MDENVESVRRSQIARDLQISQQYEEERQANLEELERQMERPPEEGKGQVVDVLA